MVGMQLLMLVSVCVAWGHASSTIQGMYEESVYASDMLVLCRLSV